MKDNIILTLFGKIRYNACGCAMPTACGHYMFTDMLVALLRLSIEPLDFRIEPPDFRIKPPLYFLRTRSRSVYGVAVHKVPKYGT